MSSRTILFLAQPQSVTGVFSRLKEAGFEVGLAESLAGALSFVRKSQPVLVFSRPALPGYSVRELLTAARDAEDFPPVIVFTDRGATDEARELLELGARDYWLEPLVWEKIEAAVPDEEPQRAPQPKKPTPSAHHFEIIGRHPAMARVLALARQVARSKATVLISGESGTGKEMFARFLHCMSDRADKPFVAINCAALPEHLLESELFGHEKGAFTGAIQRKLGKFELAHGGTILLDEISEMDLGLQAKLLRVLQESEFDRVGGMETVRVDVRVLATTNRKLEKSVEEGTFRQDLYYRLNVIPLRLPALRERGDDVMVLAEHFVGNFCRTYGLPMLAFSEEALAWLKEYDWPGNVRELQNLMERAVLLAGRGPIRKGHFLIDSDTWQGPEEPLDAETAVSESEGAPAGISAQGLPGPGSAVLASGEIMTIGEMEKRLILRSLDHTAGNRTQAAELLGISVRTLRNKLVEYREQGIVIP